MSRVSGCFRDANGPARGHDQKRKDHGDDSYNACCSHWVASIALDCDVCNLGWNESALCDWAHTECRFFSEFYARALMGHKPRNVRLFCLLPMQMRVTSRVRHAPSGCVEGIGAHALELKLLSPRKNFCARPASEVRGAHSQGSDSRRYSHPYNFDLQSPARTLAPNAILPTGRGCPRAKSHPR